jgi:hypothetical protein
MYAILDKAKSHTENIRGLNLAAVICTTVKVFRLMWQCEPLVTIRPVPNRDWKEPRKYCTLSLNCVKEMKCKYLIS